MSGLFSTRVATAEGRPEDLQECIPPDEMACIQKSVEKRRIEFIAGRTCARRALKKLGITGAVIPVGEKREPEWPPGIVGSVSHTKGYCGAAVARQAEVRGLGFDVERVGAVREELWLEIVSEQELAGLVSGADGDKGRFVALAFSAKEAFFKYQYPLSRQWVGLHDVEVHLNADDHGFWIVPGIDIAPVCAKGARIEGKYVFRGDYVLTGIEVSA